MATHAARNIKRKSSPTVMIQLVMYDMVGKNAPLA